MDRGWKEPPGGDGEDLALFFGYIMFDSLFPFSPEAATFPSKSLSSTQTKKNPKSFRNSRVFSTKPG